MNGVVERTLNQKENKNLSPNMHLLIQQPDLLAVFNHYTSAQQFDQHQILSKNAYLY